MAGSGNWNDWHGHSWNRLTPLVLEVKQRVLSTKLWSFSKGSTKRTLSMTGLVKTSPFTWDKEVNWNKEGMREAKEETQYWKNVLPKGITKEQKLMVIWAEIADIEGLRNDVSFGDKGETETRTLSTWNRVQESQISVKNLSEIIFQTVYWVHLICVQVGSPRGQSQSVHGVLHHINLIRESQRILH